MAFHSIWITADPTLSRHLVKAAAARRTAHRAAWTALSRRIVETVRRLAEAARRERRRRASMRALGTLSDKALADIGLSRGDIAGVARTAADAAPPAGLTVREIHRLQDRSAEMRTAGVVPLGPRDGRRRRPVAASDRSDAAGGGTSNRAAG